MELLRQYTLRPLPIFLVGLCAAALLGLQLIAEEPTTPPAAEKPTPGLNGSIGRAAREAGPSEDMAGSDATDPAAAPPNKAADAVLAGEVTMEPAMGEAPGTPKKSELERGVL